MKTKKPVITLKQLRAKLKPLGYTVKTKLKPLDSTGKKVERVGMIHRISDNQELLPVIEATKGVVVMDNYGNRVSGLWS